MRRIATLLSFLFSIVLAASTPRYGGTLIVAMPDQPPGLDPTISTSQAIARIVYDNVLQGLVRINRKGEIVPCLAERWSVSPDGLTYTFDLRPHVLFQNGEPLTARDVVLDLERAMDPHSDHTHHEYYQAIASVEAPNPLTVVLHLKYRDANLLFNLARPDSVIYPPQDVLTLRTDPIGTGPFKFVRWIKNDEVILERFHRYWDPKLPYLNRVIFRFLPNPETQLAALEAGQVDVIGDGLSPENALALKQMPGIKVLEGYTTAKMVMAINNAIPPFNNLLVRRAIAYATNREALIQGAMFGMGTPIGSHATPAEYYYKNLTGLYPYNPAKARQLLAEAGYPHGFSATLDLPQPYIDERRTGEVLAEQLAQVGIHLRLRVVQWDYWLSHIFIQGDYQLTVIAHVEPLDMCSIYTDPHYYFHYHNPRVNALCQEARETLSLQRRIALYGKVQTILAEDVVNDFLFNVPNLVALRDVVHHWWINQPIVALDVTRVWLSR